MARVVCWLAYLLAASSLSAKPVKVIFVAEATAKGEAYRKFLAEVKADVIGVCEFSEAFATNGALSA